MTFDELKTELRPLLWPDGEQENLLAVHDAFFNEALYDLVSSVPCYQYNHTDVYPHCATYFNCGLTVLPKPPGPIIQLYVIDRIDPETGQESEDADDDWCSKVQYHQVDYAELKRFVDVCERCNVTDVQDTADSILTAIFGVFRRKRRYVAPTDEGLETAPPLPPGFHYPQSSTDATGRSPGGVWAIYRGRIYIAPWIQSTETVVIEWNGNKSKWSDADKVDDDIKFKQAVRLHVAMQHESAYGEPGRAAEFHDQFYGNPNRGLPGALPTLIHDCLDQNRERSRTGETSGALGAAAGSARGLGQQTGVYYNDQAFSYTVKCPSGKSGGGTSTVEIGEVASSISVADANAKAQRKAQDDANRKFECEDSSGTIYYNRARTATAYCPEADGDTPAAVGTPVTKSVEAGLWSSTVSQDAADEAAYQAALALARAQLSCTYYNAEFTYTAKCPADTIGDDEPYTVNKSAFNSTISQADADAKAEAEAKKQATALLECEDDQFIPIDMALVCNDAQDATVKTGCLCPTGGKIGVFTGTGYYPADQICETVAWNDQKAAKLRVNKIAYEFAMREAQQDWNAQCAQYKGECQTPTTPPKKVTDRDKNWP